MIVQFGVANFRSFDGEETLSMVASKRLMGHHDAHTVAIPNSEERALRAGIVYGANGAGKSNLFKALGYLQWLATSTKRSSGTGRVAFRFGEGPKRPTEFDLQFISEGKLLRYGLVVEDERIAEEWLVELVGGRERVVYERVTGADGKTQVAGKGLAECGAKVVLMAELGGKQHHSFLASVKNSIETAEVGGPVKLAIEWFQRGLVLIPPDAILGGLGKHLLDDPLLSAFASRFLYEAGTGVDSVDVKRRPLQEGEVGRFLKDEWVSDEPHDQIDDEDFVILRGDGTEFVREKGKWFEQEIVAWHSNESGEAVKFRLLDESDGTQKLLTLVPALHDLKQRAVVYVIDEMDRSLHPLMVRHFVETFLAACQSGPRQLLVTTHESRLLDLKLLRRDEIWFAEKDANQATRLYSLADFHVRQDLRIDKQYLQGRFGAIPFWGNAEELVAEELVEAEGPAA